MTNKPIRRFAVLAGAVLLFAVAATPLAAQPEAGRSPAALLARARDVMGFSAAQNKVLHLKGITSVEQNYQSDRMYPPFFSAMSDQEAWFDPSSAVLRQSGDFMFPGSSFPPSVTVDNGKHAESMRGERRTPVSRHDVAWRSRYVWAVIADWSTATGVRVVGTETYRDYPRIVLARPTPEGEQRLYLDPKSGFPVKLDYTEPHYLWGQRHIEYLWSTWIEKDGIVVPGSAIRLADGAVEDSQTFGTAELIARDAAPALDAPAAPAKEPSPIPLFLQPIAPQTIQVSANTWILANPGYREVITRIGDEVYVLDATQGEERARQDADAIAKRFPGKHKINVVVTDLAWPHVSGLRYWVAQGATIISHPAARSFLQSVVDRKWTLVPDALERARSQGKASRMNFIAVDRPTAYANGALRILPIDGIGSEVALMVYLPGDKFLWASDFVQTVDEPSLYAAEVIRAASAAGIEPERVAAEHLSLTTWNAVLSAQTKRAGEARGQ